MKKFFLTMLAAACLVSCTKNPAEKSGKPGTLRIEGESAASVSVLTRAGDIKELEELGESVPDPMEMCTLVSCMNRAILLDGENPWKFHVSANEANKENFLYMPAGYTVTIGSAAAGGSLPDYADISSGETVSSTERPYHTGNGPLVPLVAEGKNKPYFEGRTVVTLEKGGEVTARVTLKVANTAVRIGFTDAFRKYFGNGAEILIKTKGIGDGTDETTAAGTFTVTYDSGEGTLFWIRPQGFTISGAAVRQDPSPGIIDAVPVKFADYAVPDESVKPQTLYTYTFDVENAGSVSGGDAGGIRIILNDEPIEIIEEDIELNPKVPNK